MEVQCRESTVGEAALGERKQWSIDRRAWLWKPLPGEQWGGSMRKQCQESSDAGAVAAEQ